MPFDGFVMKSIINCIAQKLIGLNVRNIYLSKNSLFFSFDVGDLKVCVNPNFAHISLVDHLIKEPERNVFVDLLRSRIRGAKVIEFFSHGHERIAVLKLKKIDEIGSIHNYVIYFDVMGKHSNVILVENDEIIDAFKRVETRMRRLLPGEKFVFFNSEKKNIEEISSDEILGNLISKFKDKKKKLSEFLYSSIQGFSKITAQELLYRAGLEDKSITEVNESDVKSLFGGLMSIADELRNNKVFLYYKDDRPVDVSSIRLNGYNDEKLCEDVVSCVNEYFEFIETREILEQKRKQLLSVIKTKINQYEELKEKIINEILECAEADKYRKYGELLKIYSYQIEHGIESIDLFDWETGEYITVPVEKNLTPIENSIRYFNLYSKLKRKLRGLEERKSIIEKELMYFQQLLITIENAEHLEELNEIEDEMVENDLIKSKRQKREKRDGQLSQPRKYIYNGFTIYVGKNNRQNDELVRKANNNDLWLHVQGMPGAHVIVKTNGRDIDEDSLIYAAKLAAMYSKGKYSTNVPVDYTLIKYVKKPKGFRPGLVLYSNFKTIFVDPT
ncbi:MAG: NFACT family protein [Fervidobacterium sp.]